MGYGTRALDLLRQYYSGNIPSVSEGGASAPTAAATVDDSVSYSCSGFKGLCAVSCVDSL